jgi:hypothetical protein
MSFSDEQGEFAAVVKFGVLLQYIDCSSPCEEYQEAIAAL